MPGVDILMQLGAAEWTAPDAAKLQHAQQRARFDIVGGNAELKAALDTSPQLRGWVVINPVYPERSNEEMRRYLGSPQWLGAMLHPEMCGESLASSATREALNAYRRYTKPLLVHVADETAVRQLEELAREFSTLKIVAGGAGYEDWQACMWAAKRAVNIYLEPFTGGTHRGKLETILETIGPNRVVFASGYPDHNPGAALGLLVDAKISDAEKQNIITNNAVRLFNLRAQPRPE
jgi:predicted TIM-barrel fold metal-dependent hydrolase